MKEVPGFGGTRRGCAAAIDFPDDELFDEEGVRREKTDKEEVVKHCQRLCDERRHCEGFWIRFAIPPRHWQCTLLTGILPDVEQKEECYSHKHKEDSFLFHYINLKSTTRRSMETFDLTIPLNAKKSDSVTLVVPLLACRDERHYRPPPFGDPSNCWKGPHVNMDSGHDSECHEKKKHCKWHKIAYEKTSIEFDSNNHNDNERSRFEFESVRTVVKDAAHHLCQLAAKLRGSPVTTCKVQFGSHQLETLDTNQMTQVPPHFECLPTLDMADMGKSRVWKLMGISSDADAEYGHKEWSLVCGAS